MGLENRWDCSNIGKSNTNGLEFWMGAPPKVCGVRLPYQADWRVQGGAISAMPPPLKYQIKRQKSHIFF